MHLLPNLLLFALTFIGGSLPLWLRPLDERRMHLLLSFSGSFLLCITFLHLLPESFSEEGHHGQAGLYLIAGFFLQLFIQRFTHGVEHGHVHIHTDGHQHQHFSFTPVAVGLGVHALMEGFPLGFNYEHAGANPSLYLAVAAHKLPETLLFSTLLLQFKGRRSAWTILLVFALLTPLGSIIASLCKNFMFMTQLRMILIVMVAGAFIHIATTIFFESGTRHHMITRQKVVAMLLGVGAGLATLLLE